MTPPILLLPRLLLLSGFSLDGSPPGSAIPGTPSKNSGVGCHFLLQCVKVKSESEVSQSCRILSDPMDCSLPGSSVHGISRQEYWSRVPLPSPPASYRYIQMAP